MKFFTLNLVKFAIWLFILTAVFRYGLSTVLESRNFEWVWVVALLYGMAVFTVGWRYGKKDNIALPLYDIGFRFHLTTYVICNAMAELWYLFGFQSKYESIYAVHLTTIFWGLGVIVHLIFYILTRKNAIRGISKSDIFE